ncbi:GTPase HflX [Pseudohongiella sp. SYSU M77423]|uniref:ribosome rescue GTPase HflX n=1 Tax=Pseudohongiella sp. SYSU M77423 TaxID=3042312 RepID=UPI0024811B43|nr:ribosome rescue GTPase HflX [Pseudohongiella sp. SYSU M77423]MDH7943995.1 GTPase HflX [Pseudohongiella sp. SYSU M77423]MEC8859006.1 ribosome rescue GTPase HflX [Pseudomonadota bacterium]
MFFERPEGGETSVLVHIDLDSEREQEDPIEFEELVRSSGADPVCFIKGSRKTPDARTFVGQGKLEEIAAAVKEYEAALVLFNHALSPSQERNLEKALKCRVLDRTGLILDIFAQRARTYEGKLQVELAQLQHTVTRLKRGWTHLDRQKGGVNLRGAGETQLELDQRMIRQRIKNINKSLEKVRAQREQGRRSRKRAEVPIVSLVGYTNAGKSSLFNRMTSAEIYAADQLFATLDATLRRIDVPSFGEAILVDTVGFISHLPHKLVEAFRATLEETSQADLLLHVVDVANEDHDYYIEQVHEVLTEIGADEIPTVQVLNKIDLLDGFVPRIDRDDQGQPQRVWMSARTGEGADLLLQAISEMLGHDIVNQHLTLAPDQGRLRAKLYARGAVTAERVDEQGQVVLGIKMPRADFERLLQEDDRR